jgi:para-aminobenzoate N-oxygenase AurF
MTTATPTPRIERLSAISARRVLEPDQEVPGEIGHGQVIADELLSVHDLGLDLTAEERRTLAREEIASITEEGIRFESILCAGFSILIQRERDLTEPWVTYVLHELGEETRHSRLFVRLLDQLQPTAINPFNHGVMGFGKRRVLNFITKRPVLFYTMVLAGEEIPDLLQKRSLEHPDTDPFLAKVNRYHRQEEARHLAFARMRLPELWARAPWRHRFAVRRLAPSIIQMQYEGLLHPGIYQAAGLPGWRTWHRVHRSASVTALCHQATQPILQELVKAGAFKPGRIPRAWRRLCGVNRSGQPLTAELGGRPASGGSPASRVASATHS